MRCCTQSKTVFGIRIRSDGTVPICGSAVLALYSPCGTAKILNMEEIALESCYAVRTRCLMLPLLVTSLLGICISQDNIPAKLDELRNSQHACDSTSFLATWLSFFVAWRTNRFDFRFVLENLAKRFQSNCLGRVS